MPAHGAKEYQPACYYGHTMEPPVNAYDETSGLTLSRMTLRNAALPARIKAAAAAGFRGIGWQYDDFTDERITQGLPVQAAMQLLDESDVRALEVEFFREWVGRENDTAYRDSEGKLLALAGMLGARYLNVAVFEHTPQEAIVASLRGLCQRAAEQNLIVQLEPMAYTPPVNTLRHAWEIVQAVNKPNAGIVIDAWQWAHEHETAETLKPIPPERITCIQLSDSLAEPLPDAASESRHHRCIPGKGSMDLPGFLRDLSSHGVQAPLSVEVMSDELDALPPVAAAVQVADGTRSVLKHLR